MSLSQGAADTPLEGATAAPNEAVDVPDKATETPDDPSDKAEPETRLADNISDGLGLSKLLVQIKKQLV